jgi:ferritin-like metal-binding protein YciE
MRPASPSTAGALCRSRSRTRPALIGAIDLGAARARGHGSCSRFGIITWRHSMETPSKLLRDHVRDMLAIENEMHAAFRRQEKDGRLRADDGAQRLVSRVEDTIDRHLEALRGCLEEVGGKESALKKALGSMLGAAAGIYDGMRRDDPISRNLRDDYIALSTASVCYEMLHATALAAGKEQIADLALRHLQDYAQLVMSVGELLPHALVKELSREGKLPDNREAAARAVENTRKAWASGPAMTPAV